MTSRDANASEQVIALRRHPVVLTRPLVATLAGLIVAAVVSEASPAPAPVITIAIWVAWGVLLVRLIWKTAEWAAGSLLITPQRLSITSGFLSRRTAFMPIAKVANMSLQETFLGRLLGYGELILELEGRDQPLCVIDHVPYSDRLYLELYNWFFL